MKKALMRGFALILLVALVVSGTLNAFAFNFKLTAEARSDLRDMACVFALKLDFSGDVDAQANEFSSAADGRRVTVVAGDGTVLGDSQVDHESMRNHLDAPEIAQAALSGFGSSIRNSQAVGSKLVYAAIKTENGAFVRVAGEVSGIVSTLLSLIPVMIIALLIALFFAVLTTRRFSSRVLQPVFEMNESLVSVKEGGKLLDTGSYRYDELVSLAGKINNISKDLSEHISGLQQEKDKQSYILDNVREGFMLLDEKQNVLIINATACNYLGCTKSVIGESLFKATRNPDFLRLADHTLSSGNIQRMDMVAEGAIIEVVFFRPAGDNGFSAALIATMNDVREIRTAVKIKRDFFSDASHELKTPITSIKGTAELLCSDMDIPEAQKKELLTRIGVETRRMNSLINDIIMINRMESGESAEDRKLVEVYGLVRECLEEIRPLTEQENLTVSFRGEPVTINAVYKDLRALISNLLVNAEKYNRQGGTVDITLELWENEMLFSVRNDGEPIPLSQQGRVFERFYRVDSGRSRAVGGTGLGLAIVKHVADSMEGSVTVRSDSENGTLFTVRLPLL